MTDFQFEEERQNEYVTRSTENKSFLTRLVFATGLVSTEKQAEYILIGVAVIAIILSFVIPALMKTTYVPTDMEKLRALTAPGMVQLETHTVSYV